MNLSLLFKSKYFPLGLSLSVALIVAGFCVWVINYQNNTQSTVLLAVQQRQAIIAATALASSLDLNNPPALQEVIKSIPTTIPELKQISVYMPKQQGFEVLASTNLDTIGLVLSDPQKQKSVQTKQIVTYQKKVINTSDGNQVVGTEIIPVIPVIEAGEVKYLVEVFVSSQEIVEINQIFTANNTFFFGLLATGLIITLIWLGLKTYRNLRTQDLAVESISRKDELLAVAAHDLRGPLIVIRQDIKEIMEKGMELGADRFAKLSSEILNSTMQTITFLEDLLMISRFERNKEQIFPRPAFLQETLLPLIEQFKPQAAAKGINLILQGDVENLPKLIIDPGKIGQCLGNYLSNAIKYSDKGEVVVKLEVKLAKDKRYLVISVQDQGAGIAAEDISKLFKSFSRVGATRKTHPGNGLGLYIVKQIIESHGGKVGIESQLGKGSTFYLSLPVPDLTAVK
jgi:signal transduction histidine kinase